MENMAEKRFEIDGLNVSLFFYFIRFSNQLQEAWWYG